MDLQPLGDRLIVEVLEGEETTSSGIVLPDTAQEKPQRGRVLAVGPGNRSEQTGELIPLDVAEGDEVIYSKYGGTEVKVDGELIYSKLETGKFPDEKWVLDQVGARVKKK